AERFRKSKDRLDGVLASTRTLRAELARIDREQQDEIRKLEEELGKDRRLTSEERETAVRRVREKHDEDRKRVREANRKDADLLAEEPRLRQRRAREVERYGLEVGVRLAELERFVRRFPRVRAVRPGLLTSGPAVEALLQSEADAGNAPLTAQEQQKAAARAAELLAALAEGDPK